VSSLMLAGGDGEVAASSECSAGRLTELEGSTRPSVGDSSCFKPFTASLPGVEASLFILAMVASAINCRPFEL
jgi:hypothetical protein